MTALTCETCDPLLVDLALGELNESLTQGVREHAAECEACTRALARLAMGRRAARELVLAEAPDMSRVLAAARQRVAENHAARVSEPGAAPLALPTEHPPQAPARGSLFDEAVRWLGAWAARPQVAMATLFMLMVGIGLWYVPQLRWHPSSDPDGTMVEPDTTAELLPSRAIEPREAVPLGADREAERHELAADDDVRPTVEIASAVTVEDPERLPTHAPAHPPSVAEAEDRESDGVPPEQAGGELQVAELTAGDSLGRVEEGPLPDLATAPRETAIALASPPEPGVARIQDTEGYRVPSSAAVTRARPAPTTPPPVHAPTVASAESAPPPPSVADLLPNAIHRQARSLAAAGHCSEAVPRYEALLRDHVDYADAPRAMLELGECDRVLGRLDAAAGWIARAERFPSVSVEARRARVRLDSESAASDRAVDVPTATSH